MGRALRYGAGLAKANRGALVVAFAVSLVVLCSLAQATDFAQFEQRAMTRLFLLAAFDTLVGARIVVAARIREPGLAVGDPEEHVPSATLPGVRRGLRRRCHRTDLGTRKKKGEARDRTAHRRRA